VLARRVEMLSWGRGLVCLVNLVAMVASALGSALELSRGDLCTGLCSQTSLQRAQRTRSQTRTPLPPGPQDLHPSRVASPGGCPRRPSCLRDKVEGQQEIPRRPRLHLEDGRSRPLTASAAPTCCPQTRLSRRPRGYSGAGGGCRRPKLGGSTRVPRRQSA
jgi:hypothetical protein